MTRLEKENYILKKLVEDLAELSIDHLEMMTQMCHSSEEVLRWRMNREKLNTVEKEFDDFLLVRSGREPIFTDIRKDSE